MHILEPHSTWAESETLGAWPSNQRVNKPCEWLCGSLKSKAPALRSIHQGVRERGSCSVWHEAAWVQILAPPLNFSVTQFPPG